VRQQAREKNRVRTREPRSAGRGSSLGSKASRAHRVASREEASVRHTLGLWGAATAYGVLMLREGGRSARGRTLGGRTALATGDFGRDGWLGSLDFKKGSFGWGWELRVRPWFGLGTCIVPDGVEYPDKMRTHDCTRAFMRSRKPAVSTAARAGPWARCAPLVISPRRAEHCTRACAASMQSRAASAPQGGRKLTGRCSRSDSLHCADAATGVRHDVQRPCDLPHTRSVLPSVLAGALRQQGAHRRSGHAASPTDE